MSISQFLKDKMLEGSSSETLAGDFQEDWKESPEQHFLKCFVGSNLGKTVPPPSAFGATCSRLLLETHNAH